MGQSANKDHRACFENVSDFPRHSRHAVDNFVKTSKLACAEIINIRDPQIGKSWKSRFSPESLKNRCNPLKQQSKTSAATETEEKLHVSPAELWLSSDKTIYMCHVEKT